MNQLCPSNEFLKSIDEKPLPKEANNCKFQKIYGLVYCDLPKDLECPYSEGPYSEVAPITTNM